MKRQGLISAFVKGLAEGFKSGSGHAPESEAATQSNRAVPYANLTRELTPWPARQAIYTAVDVETTGLDPTTDRIVEIGLVKFTGEGTVLDEFATLVNSPGSSPDAQACHQINDADIADAPSICDALREAFAFMDGTVVVSHKWEFEEGFLAAAAAQCGLSLPNVLAICTRQFDGRGYSLKIFHKSATGKFHDAHAALSDARAVREVLLWMMGTAPNPLYLTSPPPPPGPPYTGGDCLISCRAAVMSNASMAELINAFPQSPHARAGDPNEVENYLALLAESIEDGWLTHEEIRALTQQVQRTRLTGTQIWYTHQLAWESQFPDRETPTAELDPNERRERYLMAEGLGLTDLAADIDAVIASLEEPKPDASARFLKSLRIGTVGETTEIVQIRDHAKAYGAKIAVRITKTVKWMVTVTPDAVDAPHEAARRFGIPMVTPEEGAKRLADAIRAAELRALERQRQIDAMEAQQQEYLDQREAYWRPVWRPSELDYDPEPQWY